MSIEIKPTRGAEVKLCRMLLGNEASTHPSYRLLVAAEDEGLPLGVASVRCGSDEALDPWGVHLAAVPATPANGAHPAAAHHLLQFAKSFAAAHGAGVLRTLRWFVQDSEEQAFWTSLGFATQQIRYAHEISVARSHERLAPLIQQIRDHDWIPDNARVVPLAEADVQAVCDLHLKHLGGSLEHLLPMLDGTAPHPYDGQASLVLMCGERAVGFTLGWFPEPAICEVSANVLDPSVRLGWADFVLKYDALEAITKRGATSLRFFTAEQHRDSRRSLEWVGGGTSRVEVRMQTTCA